MPSPRPPGRPLSFCRASCSILKSAPRVVFSRSARTSIGHREQVTCFGMLVRSGRAVGDQRPARWLQRDLASMPGMLAALPVEDPGDLGVGVVGGQAADQADGVLIGADRWWLALGGVVSWVRRVCRLRTFHGLSCRTGRMTPSRQLGDRQQHSRGLQRHEAVARVRHDKQVTGPTIPGLLTGHDIAGRDDRASGRGHDRECQRRAEQAAASERPASQAGNRRERLSPVACSDGMAKLRRDGADRRLGEVVR